MASVELYPPKLPTYTPAFILGTNCEVQLSITNYNVADDIGYIQISVVNPNTNQSVLDQDKYPAGIKMQQFDKNMLANKVRYFFTLDAEDFKNININQYYKLQVRFVSSSQDLDINQLAPKKPVEKNPNGQSESELAVYGPGDSWIQNNLDYFSEWSNVSLIRPISEPSLVITMANPYNNILLYFSAKLKFSDENEKELLKSYRCQLREYGDVLEDSGTIKMSNYIANEFDHQFKRQMAAKRTYQLFIEYETENGYFATVRKEFVVQINESKDKTKGDIKAEPDFQNGSILLTIDLSNVEKTNTPLQFVIKRTSNQSGFLDWETIHHVYLVDEVILPYYQWADRTPQSGMFYQYGITEITPAGQTALKKTHTPSVSISLAKDEIAQLPPYQMVELQDMFLVGAENTLKIKYNQDVSNFKYVVSDSVTNTLGSKYPIVRRNAVTMYKQFTFGGYITGARENYLSVNVTRDGFGIPASAVVESGYLGDLFITPQQLYRTITSLYGKYNDQIRLALMREQDPAVIDSIIKNIPYGRRTDYFDPIFEHYYREEVMKFLYQNRPKLFKSEPEGNILGMLTNISLTPEKRLGRNIYSFTAQFNEIAEADVPNLIKYEILDDDTVMPVYRYVIEAKTYDELRDYVTTGEEFVIFSGQNIYSNKYVDFDFDKNIFGTTDPQNHYVVILKRVLLKYQKVQKAPVVIIPSTGTSSIVSSTAQDHDNIDSILKEGD